MMKNSSVLQDTVLVDISEWCSADIDANREIIFAVGDVHGCADLLDSLLNAFGHLDINDELPRRLVFLGDLINRGPHTIKVLERWAHEEPIAGVTKVDRLMGNHEQLLLLAMRGHPLCARAYPILVELGGDCFLQELRKKSGMPAADLSIKLLVRALGPEIANRLQNELKTAIAVGNLVFVHAGIAPHMNQHEFLSLPAQALPADGIHWAWIEGPFLTWQGGFNGKIIVHGHTPPRKHRELTHQDDPHVLSHGRLGLDAGSSQTGVVAGAQIEDGRYRVLRARNT